MSKVLVATHEFVRRSMAGPAIRAYELALQLSAAGNQVTLAVPVSTDLEAQPFPIVPYDPTQANSMRSASIGQDVLVASCGVLPQNPVLRQTVGSIVIDLYDPFHLENLASAALDPEGGAYADWSYVISSLDEQLRMGDFFLCASERQRDHWIGALAALNRINPATFGKDPALRSIIDVVPFGVSATPPSKHAPAMRGVIPGIGADDFVLLWNGGIYNWFDPLSLIEAVAQVARRRPQVRLVFLSTTHPNPSVPQMVVATQARKLAEEHGLVGKHVFFNETWVPYEQRADWLLEADAGVSTHLDHAETRYSYRTRLLDCFWAGLPVICTAGDSVADLIEREEAGLTVPPADVPALARAIEALMDDPERRRRCGERARAIAGTLTWARAAEPLLRFCAAPARAADLAGRPPEAAVTIPLQSDEERWRRMYPERAAVDPSTTRDRTPASIRLAVCVSDHGNRFMRELADYLLVTLRPAVDAVEVVGSGVPASAAPSLPLIVAPHEYCELDPAFQRCDQDAVLRRSALVNTEQPGTPWFDVAVRYCARAGLVFDINQDGVTALRRRGIEAHHFPLGYHAGIDRYGGQDGAERTIDVTFMGDINDRRGDLLAQYASILARHRFQMLPTDSTVPIREEGRYFLLGTAKAEFLSRTKVLLDIHRGPGAYFAWQRVLPAIANGAVVVTEDASGYAPLRPFEHFVMAPYDVLPYWVEALLVDEQRRHEIAERARRFVTTALTTAHVLPRIYPLLEGLAARNASQPAPKTVATRALAVRRTSALPTRIVPPRTSAAREPVHPQGPLLRKLFLANRRLGQRLSALERARSNVRIVTPRLETSPAWQATTAGDVSVVVTVHDYEQYVDACLDSVLASRGVVPEVVVIDDASSDGSAERVRAYVRRHPELPLALLSFPVNRGLPAARNEGFRHARSPYVFVLDVDNLVYPSGLARLRAALEETSAGFAYGLIELFGDVRDLMSRYPWDPRRILRGNYIDAMAMIRRSTWEQVGGYVEQSADADVLYGWEDWDFWLGCAERGIRGEFVAEIVARYRRTGTSMISVTNLDKESMMELARARHPSLDWSAA
jgi:glycosyltransferase involved in cell wall biosynthesis